MRVAVLGPVEVTDGNGRTVPVGSPAQRHVLAVLAANRGRTVSTDVLLDALWPEDAPPAALASLRSQVSRLRRMMGDAVVGRGDGYALDVEPAAVDAERFEAVVARARREPVPAVELVAALGWWRGRVFAEFADSAPLRPHAARLDGAREELRVVLARALLAEGTPGAAADVARELLAENPSHEPAWVVLVEALTAEGRAVEAADAYREAVATLGESGFDPGPALKAAHRWALAGGPEPVVGAAARAAPLGSARTSARPSARPFTRLVGRDRERAAVQGLVDGERLVTLVGPGGVGKTLLALHVAHDRADRHGAGVRIAELGRLSDPQAVEPAVATALGLDDAPESLDRAGALDALLVLDNCEHVIEDVARLVPRLLTGGARLRILATSREPIAVGGEHVVHLAPLPSGTTEDGADSAGRELFLDRARQARPDVAVPPDQLDRIVDALDGLPLALQMAAARLGAITPDELERDLATGLERLRSVRRDVDRRHRSVRDVIGWSEALLDDEARRALAEFSVFSGPVTSTAARRVAAASPALIDDLVTRSLLVADTRTTPSRYRALAVVRAVGRDRLFASGQDPVIRRRHADWVLETLTGIDATLRTTEEAAGLAAYREVYDELRAAHRWARESAPSLAVQLSRRGHLAGQALMRREPGRWALELEPVVDAAALASGVLDSSARAASASDAAAFDTAALDTALLDSAVLACVLASTLSGAGRLAEVRERGSRAVAVLDGVRADHPAVIQAHDGMLDAALYAGDLEAGLRHARDLAEAAQRHGDALFADVARVGTALCRGYAGQVDAALDAVTGPPTGPAPSALGWLLYARGEVVLDHDPPAALESLDRAIGLARAIGHRYIEGVATLSAVTLRARAGDPHEAREAFAALLDHQLGGDVTHLETTLRNLVTLLRRLDRAPDAARLLGTVTASAATPTYGAEAERLARDEEALRTSLGDLTFERAFTSGRSDGVWPAAKRARAVLADL